MLPKPLSLLDIQDILNNCTTIVFFLKMYDFWVLELAC